LEIDHGMFIDDDGHTLTYSLSMPSGLTLPIDSIYYELKSNTMYGSPTTKGSYYFEISATDGIGTVSEFFYIVIS